MSQLPDKYKCDDGTEIECRPGKKSENDFKIYTRFPNQPWPHTLEYIGHCIRLKAEVEERSYPREKGFKGRNMLLHFIQECVFKKEISIKDLCKKFKIKLVDEQ